MFQIKHHGMIPEEKVGILAKASSGLRGASLSGAISAPIARPVSANARKKPSSMETGAKENQDTNVRYRWHKQQSIGKEEP